MQHFDADDQMTVSRLRIIAALFAAVIVLAASQIVIAAHTAKYGEGPHKHDGQVCVLSIASHGGVKAIPAAAYVLAVTLVVWRAGSFPAQTERAAIAIRAAKPRGPPSL